MDRNAPGPLKIDLDSILAARGIKKSPLTTIVTGCLKKIIHQDDLNAILEFCYPAEGWQFCEKVEEFLNITISTSGTENIPSEGRFIFASNHPLGGLDGISLIGILAKRYSNDNFRFLVNDMLMNVLPLRNVFLPINKYGKQGRAAAEEINATYASDKQMAIFPAGLVSRRGKKGIADLAWQKAFVAKAIKYHRDIIPVRFIGLNSPRFYRIAQWRKRIGFKINIEQALLPSEVFRSKGKHFKIVFGKPVPWEKLADSNRQHSEIAAMLRDKVYTLA